MRSTVAVAAIFVLVGICHCRAGSAAEKAVEDHRENPENRLETRTFLGITTEDVLVDGSTEVRVKGVVARISVKGVFVPSPAIKANILPTCIILKLDDTSISSSEQLRRLIRSHKKGDSVIINVAPPVTEAPSRQHSVKVVLDEIDSQNWPPGERAP